MTQAKLLSLSKLCYPNAGLFRCHCVLLLPWRPSESYVGRPCHADVSVGVHRATT